MMKKLLLISTAILGFSTVSFADNQASSNVYKAVPGVMTPRPTSAHGLKASSIYDATDITIINAIPGPITAEIPGYFSQPIASYLDPNYVNWHLTSSSIYSDTELVIYNPAGAGIFHDYVCHRAIVTAYSIPGGYKVQVDSTLC
jgi:hypothetical protein